MAMIPDYTKAKNAALRIMKLHQQESLIDPNDDSGIILVIRRMKTILCRKKKKFCIF